MPKSLTILKIGNASHGKITLTKRGCIFAVFDDVGTHISLTQKETGKIHVELSSNEPCHSVWDEARVGIARGYGWKNAERHSHYWINREYALSDTDPLFICGLGRPKQPYPDKEKYLRYPSLNLTADIAWTHLEVSVSRKTIQPTSEQCKYSLGWAFLVFTLKINKIEQASSPNPLQLRLPGIADQ